jgi:hypothetical protein
MHAVRGGACSVNETPIALPKRLKPARVTALLDALLVEAGLHVTLRDTLRQYPGCVHWHLKRGRERGTLELTYWPAAGRVWLSVHRNRVAPWITPTIAALQQQLQERFAEA